MMEYAGQADVSIVWGAVNKLMVIVFDRGAGRAINKLVFGLVAEGRSPPGDLMTTVGQDFGQSVGPPFSSTGRTSWFGGVFLSVNDPKLQIRLQVHCTREC